MTTTTAIEIADLTKSYGDNAVLKGVDLSVPAGSIYALLDANGAGKTTMVKILATRLKADGGTATVYGNDVSRAPALRATGSSVPNAIAAFLLHVRDLDSQSRTCTWSGVSEHPARTSCASFSPARATSHR